MPSVNISTVASNAGSVFVKPEASAAEARQALTNMRAALVGKDGAISSGYLSINTRKGGTVSLETRGRHEWGSFHSNKKDAARVVQNLILEGYGKHLNEESKASLQGELTTYLGKTGERFGTQSFVKLIDRLDARFAGKSTDSVKLPPGRLSHNFNLRLKTEGCAPQARAQFKEIIDLVRPDTSSLFKHILSPGVSKVGKLANNSTLVVGDADGSMCRTVLSAINSGHMQLKESELKLLAEVMDAEAEATTTGDLQSFQEDRSIADKLDRIVANAAFKNGNYKLVFIGDILHDRFSNNKVAMNTLIRNLHAKDAVFITGNHDVYDEVNSDNTYQLEESGLLEKCIGEEISARKQEASNKNYRYTDKDEANDRDAALEIFEQLKDIKLQNGFYGAKQLDKTASDQLLKDCFTNAYFDSQTNALYTHNGFEYSGLNNVYLTAFGFLRADNAEELAGKMNKIDSNSLGPRLQDIEKEIPDFISHFDKKKEHGIERDGTINKTDFRPKDFRMQTEQLGPVGKTSGGAPVKVIHGHNDDHGTKGNVENLNARFDGVFSPVMISV